MDTPGQDTRRLIARLLRQSLESGASIEIDGLGTFTPGRKKGFRFVPQTKPRVFIAYVEEDLAHAKTLYERLKERGFNPWLDKKKLLPGQNWPRAIEAAIQASDYFIACFSKRSVSKRGSFHCELRYALQCASRIPLDEIFFIPIRIEECLVPHRITRSIQYLDMFPDWESGFSRLLRTLTEEELNRKRKRLPLAG